MNANFKTSEEIHELNEAVGETRELGIDLIEAGYIVAYKLCELGIELKRTEYIEESNESFKSAILLLSNLEDYSQIKK